MKIQLNMTLEQYKDYCMSFFSQFDKEQLNAQLASMSIEDFQDWYHQTSTDYYEYLQPVKDLVKLIRGDYDVRSDADDPMDEEENDQLARQYRETHNSVYQEYFDSMTGYVQKISDLEQYYKDQEQERLLTIKVDGQTFKALKVISVLWSGWESDQYAWLVKVNEEVRLVTSNHGCLKFTDKAFLEEKLAEYKQAMVETQDMLSMLK